MNTSESNKEVLNLKQQNLEHGDLVLADRGFDIAADLVLHGVSLVIPPFTKGKKRLSQREIETSKALASVRIHVERTIGRLKHYKNSTFSPANSTH